MAGDIKEFPASEWKLARLRRAGVVPSSPALLSAAVLCGAMLTAIVFFLYRGSTLLDMTKTFLVSQEDPQGIAISAFDNFVSLSFGLIFLLLAVVMLVGLVQTKFLFAFSAVKFDLGRLFSLRDRLWFGLGNRLLLSLGRLIFALGWCAVWALFLSFIFAEIIPDATILGSQRAAEVDTVVLEQSSSMGQYLAWLLGTAALSGLFFGLFSYFLVVLQFQREHRMSRAELQRELQETEASPQMRSAQRDRRWS